MASGLGGRVIQQAQTMMQDPACKLCKIRIPDIYYLRERGSGWGWINELKIGFTPERAFEADEAARDYDMLFYGHAIGKNVWDMGWWLPVNYDVWWFAPNLAGTTGPDLNLFFTLWDFNINMVEIIHDPSARDWPAEQSKQQKEREVQEIESGNEGKARSGLESMFAPWIRSCII